MASNSSGLADEDGSFSDWIEIHNPDVVALDLSGYFLTDSASAPQKWQVPSPTTISPGGYLVIFASGKNRTVAGQPLHTNFSLSAGGEYLGLVAPGGAPVVHAFAPAYPAQSANVSYGLLTPVPGGELTYFNGGTPGAANNPAQAEAEAVQFSEPSRTFNQGTNFPVTLSTPSATATIRYTVNRSLPIDVAGVAPTVAVNAATDVWTAVGHGLKNGDPVQIHSSNSSYPTGSGSGITYFVTVLSADAFKLSKDLGGVFLDVSSTGSGLHVRRYAAQWTQSSLGTNIPITAHHFHHRDAVEVSSTGTLPTPLVAGTTYYVVNNYTYTTNLNNLSLSATAGGAAISLTTVGSGIHTIRRIPSTIYSTPITVDHSLRLRARSFQAGRVDGPPVSHSYLMLDAAAQSFTSNIPVMILHGFGTGHPSSTAPAAPTPEDTKEDVWFVFEPKIEVAGQPGITRLTNPPDLVAPGYFERRGSSTFGAAKYSMTMGAFDELGQGADVSPLGFSSNDDFVLNAHYTFDRSLMHNDLIYRLSNEAGRYAPRTRHVEIFMSVANDVGASGGNPAYGIVNGSATGADYYGVYSFQDKISRGTNRVNVEKLELTDNTAPNVQGGYIFKIDRLDSGDSGLSGAGRSFALVQPKEWTSYPGHVQVMTTAQKSYLSTHLNAMYNALNGASFMNAATGYAAYLDVPAAIDHWWLSILPKSADAFRLSGFWHKARFGKLAMGPIFDFDRAMGSTDGRDLNPLTWRGDNSDFGTDPFHSITTAGQGVFSPNYFQRMFQDPNYWQATIDRYEDLRRGVMSTAHVHAVIDEFTETLDPGNGASTPAKRNGQKWGGSAPYRGAAANTPGTNGTFRGEAQWLKNWWGKAGAVTANGRLDFVDGQFVRPAAAAPPSGLIPAGGTVTLSSPTQSMPGVKIYYTTDGSDPRAPSTAAQTLYSPGTPTTLATLLQEISTVRAIVPTADATGGTAANSFEEWHGFDYNGNGNNADDFDDSGWYTNAAGSINGVGFDNSFAAGSVDYQPYFRIRWNTETYSNGGGTPPSLSPVSADNVMKSGTINGTGYAGNQSCFLRYPFTLTQANLDLINTPGNSLSLQIRCDDGFIAWINGTELTTAQRNAPVGSPSAPKYPYTAGATATYADASAIVYSGFDISGFASSLHVGTNILAIQGLNSGTTGSDMLVQQKIIIVGNSSPQPPYTPTLAAGAVEYTAPISITAPTQITARTLYPLLASDPPTTMGGGTGVFPNGSSWSGPSVDYYFPGAVSASQASIQISEVSYHPPGPSAAEIAAGFTSSGDFEFIRLTNTGAQPVDLTGIYFSNGIEFTAGPGLQNWLPVGQSVVVVKNPAAFQSRYGSAFTVLGQFSGGLADGGERIVLNDRTGAVISDFTYDDRAPWPAAADGSSSLLFVGGNPEDAANWRASVDPGGSAVTNFAQWQARYFLPAEIPSQGPLVNTDSDAWNNLSEYAFGSDPRSSSSRENENAVLEPGATPGLRVIRRRGASDLVYVFETATDLAGWTVGGLPESVADNGDGTETAVYRAAEPLGNRLYLRVRVSLQ
ncbi:MAG: CotH kinase family protein [Verrucomicrobiales bacterium]|nr:CotH kinase family protein [Verrucomicrobiales bacterium]